MIVGLACVGVIACDHKNPTGAHESAQATHGDLEGGLPADASAALAQTALITAGTVPLPINQSVTSSTVALGVTQTGTGTDAKFTIANSANVNSAVFGQTNGSGAALHGLSTGSNSAGFFEATNPSGVGAALKVIAYGAEGVRVQHRGLSPAGYFETVNANSNANTLELFNYGKGKALNATTSATSVASFLLNSSSAYSSAVAAETKGVGAAVEGRSASGAAIKGTSTTGSGAYFYNAAYSSKPALVAVTSGSNFVATFEAYAGNGKGVLIKTLAGVPGLQVVGGTKNAVVRTPSGSKALYTEESTEVWFTDYGFGKLARGRARVLLDPSFAQTINPDEPYHVFVQPYGRAELYVAERTPLGFVVALKEGDAGAEFSYRVVAKRLGFEGKRLEPAPWVDNPGSELR